MADVITLAGAKGGVGKSILAVTLATALHEAGRRVVLVDADPQGTVADWYGVARANGHSGPEVVELAAKGLMDAPLARAAEGACYVVIDSPGRLGHGIGAEARAALAVAHLVLLPVGPDAGETWALRRHTLPILAEAQKVRPELAARLVLTRTDRTTISTLVREGIEGLGVELLPAELGARVAFRDALNEGLGVVRYAPSSKAAEEARAIASAVEKTLRSIRRKRR